MDFRSVLIAAGFLLALSPAAMHPADSDEGLGFNSGCAPALLPSMALVWFQPVHGLPRKRFLPFPLVQRKMCCEGLGSSRRFPGLPFFLDEEFFPGKMLSVEQSKTDANEPL
ncbi:Adhesion G Protein-Coupled Receptor L2 [Manis pentadactyla]|nr:Adhesion G Protein-Coupled Receptor L2 [Manis pentadactyla]